MSSPRIIKTRSLDPAQAAHVRHPFNPKPSNIYLHLLSEPTGLTRQMVTLARLPPGQESFLPHAHTFQEEFVFILDGTGVAIIGDGEHPVEAGDFIGYPCDGMHHQLRNDGDVDLLYLMGGERTQFEISRFPTVNKVGVFTQDGVTMYDETEGKKLSFMDYVVKD